MRRICVIGTGHGGSAAAAALALKGNSVTLLKLGESLHNDHFKELSDFKTIKLNGVFGEHKLKLENVTNSPSEGIPDAEIILIFYVANYHEMVAKRISPYLRDKQMVYFCPGYLGSIILMKNLKRIGNYCRPILMEGETLPFTSRIEQPGMVSITSINLRQPFSIIPEKSIGVAETMSELFPNFAPRTSPVEVSLHNPNLVIHTIGTLMNIAQVENPRKTFAMYRDGFTDSIWKIVSALDEEKMSVLSALGFPRISYFDEFKFRTFENHEEMDSFEGFFRYASESPSGPFTLNNRYLTEDVPMGLGLLSSLGKHLNLSTPIADMLISLSGIVLDRDFQRESRSIESLGFKTIDEMISYIKKY